MTFNANNRRQTKRGRRVRRSRVSNQLEVLESRLLLNGDNCPETILGEGIREEHGDRTTYRYLNYAGDRADPEGSARDFLMAVGSVFGMTEDLDDLQLHQVRQGLVTSHTRFRQTVNGLPISDAYISVHQGPDGAIQTLHTSYQPAAKQASKRTALISADMAAEIAAEFAGLASFPEDFQQQLIWQRTGDGTLKPAWEITMFVPEPTTVELVTIVEADSRQVISQLDVLDRDTGVGDVFDPNPYQFHGTEHHDELQDNLDENNALLEEALREVTLQGLDPGTGILRGEYVDPTLRSQEFDTSPPDEPDRVYRYTRDDMRFEYVVVYHTIDTAQRYVHSLGYDDANQLPNGIRDFPTEVSVHWNGDDNSFFSVGQDAVFLGDGGVDDAEDPDIIVHEYGHALHRYQNSFWSENLQMKALGEGFGDYFAASFGEQLGDANYQAEHAACVGEWDATSYRNDTPPCLRRVDNDSIFPDDVSPSPHSTGKIWSGALWDLHGVLQRDATTLLILETHFGLPRESTFRDAALEMIQVDENLNQGANRQLLRETFCDRGILSGNDCFASAGALTLDRENYRHGEEVIVTLTDADLFRERELELTVATDNGDEVVVEMTSDVPGLFTGRFSLSQHPFTTTPDLDPLLGEQFTVHYTDLDDGKGGELIEVTTVGNVVASIEVARFDFEEAGGGSDEDFVLRNGPSQWHVSTGRGAHPGHSPNHSFYFGSGEGADGGGTYVANRVGEIVSPIIDLTNVAAPASLEFLHFIDSEELNALASVSVIAPGRTVTLANNSLMANLPFDTGGFVTERYDLSEFAGEEIQLEFEFRSFSSSGFEGWYVDDIVVEASGLPAGFGPRVVETSWNGSPLNAERVFTSEPLAVDVRFDIPVDSTNSLEHAGYLLNTQSWERTLPLSTVYDPIGDIVTYEFPSLAEGNYRLVLISGVGAFETPTGIALDGEALNSEVDATPSGDSVAGGNYELDFSVDGNVRATEPWVRHRPDGIQVYSSTSFGVLNSAEDTDTFAFPVDADESFSLGLFPANETATLTLQILGHSLPFTASGPGQPVFIPPHTVAVGEEFSAAVTGDSATDYTLVVARNAVIETADSEAVAPLDLSVHREDPRAPQWAGIGNSSGDDVDYFEFTVEHVGLPLDVVLSGQDGIDFSSATVELLDIDGQTVLATGTTSPVGDAATNYDQAIAGVQLAAPGTYGLRVTSPIAGDYVVAAMLGTFEHESNDAPEIPTRELSVPGLGFGFVSRDGVLPTQPLQDPIGDTYGDIPEPIDIKSTVVFVAAEQLILQATFASPISAPSAGAENSITGFWEVDLDQNAATGEASSQPIVAPDYPGGPLGIELFVDIDSENNRPGVVELLSAQGQVIGDATIDFGDDNLTVYIDLDLIQDEGRVNYGLQVGARASNTLTDAAPNHTFGTTAGHGGTVTFDDDVYESGDIVTIVVTDSDLVGSTLQVDVASSTGDNETITLFRSNDVYQGTIRLTSGGIIGDGNLTVGDLSRIFVSYTDEDNGQGSSTEATDSALIAPLTSTGIYTFTSPGGLPDSQDFQTLGVESLWHLSEGRADDGGHSAPHSFYFGTGEGPNGGGSYTANSSGVLLLPNVDLTTLQAPITLNFNHKLNVAATDNARISVISANEATVVAQNGDGLPSSLGFFAPRSVDLSAFAGQEIQLEFTFIANEDQLVSEGWYIDDVEILGLSVIDETSGPLIDSISPNSGTTNDLSNDVIEIAFSEPLDQQTAESLANYTLWEAGPNNSFNGGEGDDVVIPLQPTYADGQVMLELPAPLFSGRYRLTLADTITDVHGNGLYSAPGTPATSHVHEFQVAVSPDQPGDTFEIALTAGQTVDIRTTEALNSEDLPLETRFVVLSSDGIAVGEGTRDGDISQLQFEAPITDTYTIFTYAQAGAGEFAVSVSELPVVNDVVINEGFVDPPDLPLGPQPTSWSTQRSDIRKLSIHFNERLLLDADDLQLVNLGVNADADPDTVVPLVDAQLTWQGTVLEIAFAPYSLEDGVYSLTIADTATNLVGVALDGDGDGIAGGAFVYTGDETNRFYTQDAEHNGDGGVSVFDFPALSYWFAQPITVAPDYININQDDGISVFDFPPLATNFGISVVFPQAKQAKSVAAAESPMSLHDQALLASLDDDRLSADDIMPPEAIFERL